MEMDKLLEACVKYNASDLHIRVNAPPKARIRGSLRSLGDNRTRHALNQTQPVEHVALLVVGQVPDALGDFTGCHVRPPCTFGAFLDGLRLENR